MEDEDTKWSTSKESTSSDFVGGYYGSAVRSIFVIGGIVMLITLPFFTEIIPLPIYVSISMIVILAIFGGLMNPILHWVLIANSFISTIAVVFFEYRVYHAYLNLSPNIPVNVVFFWVNQVLAILFFFATYLSIKTIRAMFLKENLK